MASNPKEATEQKKDQGAPLARTATLVIDRAKWLRGGGDGELLRKGDGKMCCLGFFALECGYDPDAITGEGQPAEMACSREETPKTTLWPTWLLEAGEDDYGREVFSDSGDGRELVRTNDDKGIPEELREEHIAEVFAKHGVKVKFVGDASKTPPVLP